jgi:hypothetical protein
MTETTVKLLATPKGGHTAFFTVPAADAAAAGLQQPNDNGVINAIYDEIAVGRDYARDNATAFPAACPCCGAEKLFDSGSDTEPTRTGRPRQRKGRPVFVPSYARRAAYACGGVYELKSQIQNHTDKWWGRCPVTKDRIAQVLKKHGVEVEGA